MILEKSHFALSTDPAIRKFQLRVGFCNWLRESC